MFLKNIKCSLKKRFNINEVTAKLKEKPLNIQAVQSLVDKDAVGFVQDTFDETEAMLEEARRLKE